MKILKENAGMLTNFEVFDFLQSRGAGKDPTRVIAPIAPSEFKVYDYLEQSAASSQSREKINEFVEKSKKYNLTKGEILSIINIRPSSAAETTSIIAEWEKRMGEELVEELVEMVGEILPPPPQMETDENQEQENEENENEENEEDEENENGIAEIEAS